MRILLITAMLLTFSCTESNDELTNENTLDSELLIKANDDNSFERDLSILDNACLLYTSPSPRDGATSRMPSSA